MNMMISYQELVRTFLSVAVNNNKISNGQKINWQKKGDKTIPCIGDAANLLI